MTALDYDCSYYKKRLIKKRGISYVKCTEILVTPGSSDTWLTLEFRAKLQQAWQSDDERTLQWKRLRLP